MSTLGHYTEDPQTPLQISPLVAEMRWYAVRTCSRHERVVAAQLKEQGVSTFLPLVTRIQRWSDRRKRVEFPLFGGYLFVHAVICAQIRRTVLFTRGVAGFVSMRGEPVPVPDEEIDTVRKLLAKDVGCAAHPFLRIGDRVRVRGGSLDGLEGILVAHNGDSKLVISVAAIERSFSIRLEGYDVEVLSRSHY